LASETILVIDDSQDNLLFLKQYVLEPAGYHVLTAPNGTTGLAEAVRCQPDLLLIDLQMPNMNGIEVIRALRERGLHLPMILMAFHGSEETAIQVFRLGVRDYVIKPFTPEEILASVESALSESRLRKERDALTARLMDANHSLERRLREVSALAGIGRAVTALMDTDELLCRIVEGAVYLARGDHGQVVLYHPQEGLVTHAIKEPGHSRATISRASTDDRLAQVAIESQRAVVATRDQDGASLPAGVTAALYVPLVQGQQAIGAIGVMSHRRGRSFSGNDQSLLGAVADYAAVSLENARLFRELEAAKERENQEIRRIFQTYVAPPVVERVIANPAHLQLGGVRQQVTSLYADIRGFSTFAEQVAPEHLFSVLNGYLSVMARTVMDYEGTLDKFLGDAVMVFFNAPSPQPDHPLRAARTALAIQQAVREHQRANPSPVQLSVGIGFAAGEAVVGHVGTSDRMDYTIIGDTVNLAKRLQEAAKPGQILISGSTYDLIADQVVAEPLGTKPLKGKALPEPVFELRALRQQP
jgi:class 3 adenylate cyclase/FixJ family two-component response regulator